MAQITIDLIRVGDAERIGIRIPYNKEMIAVVRTIPGAIWSSTMKIWHVAANEDVLKLAASKLIPFANIDTSKLLERLKEIKRARHDKKFDDLSLPLREALRSFEDWMEQQRYSPKTIKNYISQLMQFFGAVNKPYQTLTPKDVEKYNLDVIIKNNFSVSLQRGLIGAVKLFYSRLEGMPMDIRKLQLPFNERRLPEVLSKEEVKRVLQSTNNLKHRAMLSLIYACGLRRSELLDMKIKDLDGSRMVIHIKLAKGKKDRIVPLGSKLRGMLIEYYKEYHPKEYLFEGEYGGRYGERSIEKVLSVAVQKCKIKKRVTLHTLRHSYATHQLESGTDIRYIQELLGHSDLKTTMIYTHVSSKKIAEIQSPFDDLGI